jgi:hypothetical protein
MGAQGQVEVDFGVHPGAVEKEVDVVATGVVATSLVEAWLHPEATTDHTVDEHIAMLDALNVQGRYLSDDNIRILVRPILPQHDHLRNPIRPSTSTGTQNFQGPEQAKTYGKWAVAWVWN